MLISSRRARVATAWVSAVAAALTFAPQGAATGASAPTMSALAGARVAQVDRPAPVSTVTLVTGDRVIVTALANGHTTTRLAPGSPSLGRPMQKVSVAGHDYLIPGWLSTAERRRFDHSLFDVTRLVAAATASTTVPVRVTFAGPRAVRDLPGINVDTTGARRTSSGSVVASGAYAPATARAPLASNRRLASTWHGVRHVGVRGARAVSTTAAGRYRLHRLTIDVVDASGATVPYADLVVLNTVDARLYAAFTFVAGAPAKLQVPGGSYYVQATVFGRTLHIPVAADAPVTDATTITLSLADATVVPDVSVAGARINEFDFDVGRSAERGGSFTAGFSGFSHPRLQPVPATLPHGEAWTNIGGHFTHGDGASSGPVDAKEQLPGTPTDLTRAYTRSDFARTPWALYANAGSKDSFEYGFGFAPRDFFLFASGYPVHFPSRTVAWVLAQPDVRWSHSIDAYLRFRNFAVAEESSPFQLYSAGGQPVTSWFRPPVGPGQERGLQHTRVWPFCIICRDGDAMYVNVPGFVGSGTDHTGFVYGDQASTFTLSAGRRVIARSRSFGPWVRGLPAADTTYRLSVTDAPTPQSWRLSTRAQTTWSFTSAAGSATVPLLMPRYSPPTSLSGVGATGHVGFRLGFGHVGGIDTRVTEASVRYSSDGGRSWRRAELRRVSPTAFRVGYPQPRLAGGAGYVDLRVTGVDAAGRKVDETVSRVYSLPSATVRPKAESGPQAAASRSAAYSAGRRACGRVSGHEARCLAIVQAGGAAALNRVGQPAGYGAEDLRDAYGLSGFAPGQTVGVVVAYDYPSAEADLNAYRKEYGLPQCTTANGCFTKINDAGEQGSYPPADQGWALEAALDLQMVSAACPSCHLVLAEADAPTTGALSRAIDAAVGAGAKVTNHSYGITEYAGILRANRHYAVPGVTAVAASGDYGYQPASFPASSPDVVSVGGTTLTRAPNARGWKERAWAYGGSGCSAYFDKPRWQHSPVCDGRTFADVSAAAAPARGVAVYDSFGYGGHHGWFLVGGTSASSPFVAGVIAQAGAGGLKPADIYASHAHFHDVVRGANGFCRGNYICTARRGYDGPTGWGTPRGLRAFRSPAGR